MYFQANYAYVINYSLTNKKCSDATINLSDGLHVDQISAVIMFKIQSLMFGLLRWLVIFLMFIPMRILEKR